MSRTTLALILLFASLASACGAPAHPVRSPQAEGEDHAEGDEARELSFRELVEALPKMPTHERSAPLFSTGSLSASPAIPIRPIPPLEEELGARLKEGGGEIQVFSPYGVVGESPLKVATLSRLPHPFLRAILIGLSGERVYLRGRALGIEALIEALEAEDLGRGDLIILTASSETPVARLAEISEELEARFTSPLAIGALLPAETRYRGPDGDERDPSAETSWRCGEGDSMRATGSEGTLERDSIRSSVEALHLAVSKCAERVPPEWTEAERRSRLRIKVGREGEIAAACFEDDHALELNGFEIFASCTIRELRRVRFPAPDPAGEVFFTLPIRFAPQ